jgi:O-antigen/teichoic acid export membrane protein
MSLERLSFKKAIGQLLSGSIIGRALSFGLNLALSRTLGPTGLGLFSLVLSTCQSFEIAARAGVDYGLSCELTEQKQQLSKSERSVVAATALQVVGLTSLVLAAVLWVWVVAFNGLLPVGLRISRQGAALTLVAIAVLESLGSLPWELLLIAGQTKLVALRQGLFAPLKLLFALVGARILGLGLPGALIGYGFISLAQWAWLKQQCRRFYKLPSQQSPRWSGAWKLVQSGLGLYGTNALAAIVFLPLLAYLAQDFGVAEVGYFRVGQILVQLFTLLPGAIAPVLFLKLRTSNDEESRKRNSEISLHLVWWIGLAALLLYLFIDHQVVSVFFGNSFLPAIQPTRLLVLMAVLDSVNQLLHTPLLASKKTRLFALTQNCSAVLAAGLGYWLIPKWGLQGFLAAKFAFSLLPVMVYLKESWHHLNPGRLLMLSLATTLLSPLCWMIHPGAQLSSVLLVVVAVILAVEGKRLLPVSATT